jgi:hypothetical protein
MSSEAFGLSDLFPASSLLAGSRMRLGVGEGLGQKWFVTEGLLPLAGHNSEGLGQGSARQIGATVLLSHQKPNVIDDEISSLAAGQCIPTNPLFPVFEVIGAGRPNHNGHRLPRFFDDLEKRVADRSECTQEVLGFQPVGNLLARLEVTTGTYR